MKKIVIICVLLAGVSSLAQERDGRSHGRNYLKDMTPEQVATLSSKRLALALDLTEAQRGQVMELQLERVKERRATMEDRKQSEGQGTALSPAERYERLNERLDRKLAYKASMKKILSEKQYADWVSMHDRNKGIGHAGGRHYPHSGKK